MLFLASILDLTIFSIRWFYYLFTYFCSDPVAKSQRVCYTGAPQCGGGLIEIKAVQSGKHQGKWKQIITRTAGREILTRRQLAEKFRRKKKRFFSDARAGQSWLNPHSLSNQDTLPSWGTPAKQTNGSGDLREKTPGTGQIQIQLRFPFQQGKHKCEVLTSYRTYAGLLGWFLFRFGVFFFPCFGMYLKVTQIGFNLNLSTPSFRLL